jgi:hypothetical protein
MIEQPAQDNARRWEAAFLQGLEQTGMVAHACKIAGIGRTTAYANRKADPDFAAAWDEIRDAALDEVEAAAFKHAKDGDPKLITFLLTTTGRYRDTKHVEHSGSLNLVELVATVEDDA